MRFYDPNIGQILLDGVDLRDYKLADLRNQFAIVLASGQTKRFKDFFAVQPQPGDSIIVPRRTITPATLRNTRDIVQIIFQGASSLGIIAALLAAL